MRERAIAPWLAPGHSPGVPHSSDPLVRPSFAEALRFWLKLGFISFGGPGGQIAIMHGELVEKRRWISEERFLHALNYCMLLPGPEATQLATYAGWLLHGTRGGLAAGVLFVLPSAAILWVLSVIYVKWGEVPWVEGVFHGLQPVVLAIVSGALWRIGRKALKHAALWVIAALAFVALFFLRAPFPLVIAGAALVGVACRRAGVGGFASAGNDSANAPPPAAHGWRHAARVLGIGLPLWFGPVLLAAAVLGPSHTLVREGAFFSKAAMVTFGGAYAVLPYVSQQAVETHGWLSAPQMMDGLGLAETTPGPLIMVLQFVGFLGGWNQPQGLNPLLAGTLGAVMTTWTTFVPCFLWIFVGAPHVERLRGRAAFDAPLTAVTAAVVGVILNLTLWLAAHVLVGKEGAGVNFFALTTVGVAIYLLHWRKWSVPAVIGLGAAAGLALTWWRMGGAPG